MDPVEQSEEPNPLKQKRAEMVAKLVFASLPREHKFKYVVACKDYISIFDTQDEAVKEFNSMPKGLQDDAYIIHCDRK